ncbi:hypothetical protein CYMTET_17279 [Cymbomonas tetramitiformis]|uniref:Uncharacterized protein n=1 Tax=Cymbomonas tetramitiformis TaxID=36881 RepID=A0AAE0GAF9_9CHLO|nr:hypothetical protein CYMTET_17279 [Cymbomonas tetramitiformis]
MVRDPGGSGWSSPGESAKDPTPIDPASVFGVIDEDTDEPRQEPSEEPIKVSKIPNDPTFVLIDVMMFEHSDSDDGLVPPDVILAASAPARDMRPSLRLRPPQRPPENSSQHPRTSSNWCERFARRANVANGLRLSERPFSVAKGFHRFKADGKDDVKLGGIVIYLKIQFENVGLDITSFDFRRRQ